MPDTMATDLSAQIDELERVEGIAFHAQQRQAIETAVTSGMTVITGGPGTGKTTIIKCIIKLLSVHGDIALAAPTGRAAKRMSEACGMEAKTLHRLLEYGGEEGDFARTQDNPLEYDALIIDEMSMVDIFLMRYASARARPRHAADYGRRRGSAPQCRRGQRAARHSGQRRDSLRPPDRDFPAG